MAVDRSQFKKGRQLHPWLRDGMGLNKHMALDSSEGVLTSSVNLEEAEAHFIAQAPFRGS